MATFQQKKFEVELLRYFPKQYLKDIAAYFSRANFKF